MKDLLTILELAEETAEISMLAAAEDVREAENNPAISEIEMDDIYKASEKAIEHYHLAQEKVATCRKALALKAEYDKAVAELEDLMNEPQ